MYRAAFLAAEQLWRIADMVQDREGSPDWNLSIALMQAVGARVILNKVSGHERANFEVLAFDRFDACAELDGTPEVIAARWRTSAGY